MALLHGRVAAFRAGQLIVDVSAFDSAQAGGLPRLRPPPSPPAHAAFVAAFLTGSVPRLARRRVYALPLLDRRHPPAALTALHCPFCGCVVEDLVLHLCAACWHYLGFVVSALGAVCWLDGVRRRVQWTAQLPAYWVAVPDGVLGLWNPLHPGVAAPLGRHSLVSMTGEICGADDEDKAMVSELLHVLRRPVMQLSHLPWRATAVDHAASAGCVRRPEDLTYRQSALLGVVVRVLPRCELTPDTLSALPLPPLRSLDPGSSCLVAVAFAADDACYLWCALQQHLPPVWLPTPALAPALRAQWPTDLYVHKLSPDAVLLWDPSTQLEYWRL